MDPHGYNCIKVCIFVGTSKDSAYEGAKIMRPLARLRGMFDCPFGTIRAGINQQQNVTISKATQYDLIRMTIANGE